MSEARSKRNSCQVAVAVMIGTGLISGVAGADPVESPYPACHDVQLIGNSYYKKNQKEVDQMRATCVDPNQVQVLPDAGAGLLEFSTKVEGAEKGREFLQKVSSLVAGTLQRNIADMEKSAACYKDAVKGAPRDLPAAPSDCDAREKAVRQEIARYQPDARLQLALSESVKPSVGDTGIVTVPEAYDLVNASLREPLLHRSVFRPKGIEPLSADEKAKALRIAQDEYNQFLGGRKAQDLTYTDGFNLNQITLKHRARYIADLQKAPILAYLPKTQYDSGDIAKATYQLLDNARAELKRIQGTVDLSNQESFVLPDSDGFEHTHEFTDNARLRPLFHMLVYKDAINQFLSQPGNKQYCGIATAMVREKDKEDLQASIGAFVGGTAALGALSFGAGAAVAAIPAGMASLGLGLTSTEVAGMALGLPLGAAFTTQSFLSDHEARMKTAQETFNRVGVDTEDRAVAMRNPADYENQGGNYVFDAALTPLNFLGSGAGALTEKAAVSWLAKGAIKDAGMSAQDASRLISLAGSRDAKVAMQAQRKLKALAKKQLGKIFRGETPGPEQLALTDAAAAKGMQPQEMRDVLDTINLLEENQAARKDVTQKAAEVVKDLDPAVFGKKDRATVERAIIAGADFEIQDPKHLAAVISTWPEGINGLSAMLERASDLMREPDYLKIADVGERQQKAYQQALDEMRQKNEKFKSLTESDWRNTKKKMMACAIGPAK